MNIKKIQLANLPTPVQFLNRLSSEWGEELWVKRDDLTGLGLTGNKVRKLEYLLADAMERGADTIITCGGIQSNHCRATAIACAELNLRCILLLRGHASREPDGNLLLDRIVGADIRFISEDEYYADIHGVLSQLAEESVIDGLRPYVIIEGGSDPIGAWGYVEAIREVHRQCESQSIKPYRIVCATGSGGTHAGMLVGAKLLNWNVDIVSVSVCYDAPETSRRITSVVEGLIDRHGLDLTFSPADIHVLEGYRGQGYAKAGNEEYNTILEVARLTGLLVDPVYTGKAMYGIKCELQSGNFPGTTLFWHTGGVYALFPCRNGVNGAIK